MIGTILLVLAAWFLALMVLALVIGGWMLNEAKDD